MLRCALYSERRWFQKDARQLWCSWLERRKRLLEETHEWHHPTVSKLWLADTMQRLQKAEEEVIDVMESRKKAFKINGRGKYKVWLPQALLRVCWGHQVANSQARTQEKLRLSARKKSRVALAVVSSSRERARHMRSSSTHIARVRNAICELFLCVQEEALKSFEFVPEQWIHIALDETQEPVSMCVRSEMCQVMVFCTSNRSGCQPAHKTSRNWM